MNKKYFGGTHIYESVFVELNFVLDMHIDMDFVIWFLNMDTYMKKHFGLKYVSIGVLGTRE